MPNFSVRGNSFTVPETYPEHYLPTVSECETLNKLLAKKLRDEVVSGRITSRQEAERWLYSDEALGGEQQLEEIENIEDLL